MSGFREDNPYRSDEAQYSAAAATNAVAALQEGHPFSLLLSEDERQRTAELEGLLDTIADASTRFARVTNPLRARLTLERLLIQVIHGSLDGWESDPAGVIRRIAERRQDENRVILVIEQAETLHPEVLRFFARTAALFPDGTPHLQVLFVGRPEFQPLLENPDSGFDEQTAVLEQYRPAPPEPLFVPPPQAEQMTPPTARFTPQQDNSLGAMLRSVWGRGLPTQMAIVGGIVIGVAAITFAGMLALTAPPDPGIQDSSSALAEMPEPGASDPDPPVLQAGPPLDEATAALRQEFDAYLIASGKTIDGATSAQKRAVYSEFLVWRARTRGPR